MERAYIGRYRVVGKLGKGGMGTVIRAADEVLNREVAIKLPNDSDPEDIRRLQQECDVLIQLQHHHIVQVYGSGSEPDLPFYIVMELVEGVSIEQLLRQQGGHLELRQALKIALAVAEALAYAHRPPLRVIHRDIKPSNVLIRTSDGAVKVTDFGIAAVLAEHSGRSVVGTLWYMAPEQAAGQGVDERSDLYALGAMCYELLTGQRPPQFALSTAQPPSLSLGSIPPEMSARIDRLVLGLLRREREQRMPQNAAGVVEELRALLEGRPSRASGSQMIDPRLANAPTRRSSLPLSPDPYAPTERPSRLPAARSTPISTPYGSGPFSRAATPAPITPPQPFPRSKRAIFSALMGFIALCPTLLLLVAFILTPTKGEVDYQLLFFEDLIIASFALVALLEGYAANRDVRQGSRVDPSRSARAGLIGGYLSLVFLMLTFLLSLVYK